MSKRMLIDATHSEETRVAVIDGNRLIEFDYESKVRKQLKGSIFLAKVTRVEPSLQAAFVNFGGNRHGFLPFAEIHPDYFRIPVADREALIADQKAMLERLAAEEEAAIAEEEAALAALERGEQQQGSMKNSPFSAQDDDINETHETHLNHDDVSHVAIVNDVGGTVETVEQDFSAPIILNDNQDDDSDDEDEDEEEDDDLDEDDSDDEDDQEQDEPETQSLDQTIEPDSEHNNNDDPSADNQIPEGHIHAWIYRAVTMYDEATGKFEATDEGTIQNFKPETGMKLRALCEAYADIVRIRVDIKNADGTDYIEPEYVEADIVETAETTGENSGEIIEAAEPVALIDDGRYCIVWLAYKADNEAMLEQEFDGGRGGRGRYGRRFRGRGRGRYGRNNYADNQGEGAQQDQADNNVAANDDQEPVGDEGQARSFSGRGNRDGGRNKGGRNFKGSRDSGRDSGRDGGRNNKGGGRQSFRSRKVEMLGGDTADGDQPFRFNLRRNYKIQEVIKRGQIMLIQVQKEERGNKGAAVTSYLSLPGRFSVLMPNSPRGGGVSRKIASFAERKRMRDILKELSVPDGMSVILRTAGVARASDEIKRDLDYLMRLWDNIRELTLESSAPSLVYEESSLVKRAVRDIYSSDIEEILVAGEQAFTESRNFMNMLMPDHVSRVQNYRDEKIPLFHRYQVESQIAEIGEMTVQLRSGGYLVINPTEALVSVDVNSGRATKERHIEETAVKTNLEAADEVARQLRLRDLGGLVVIDFIDMDDYRNNAKVERRLRDALSTDRARIQVGRISSFGLLELSRQRLNPSLTEAQYEKCPHCLGTGSIRSVDSASILALRALEEEGIRGRAAQIFLSVPNKIALYILNNKRDRLMDIERRYGFQVYVRADDSLSPTGFHLEPIKGEAADTDDGDDAYDNNQQNQHQHNHNHDHGAHNDEMMDHESQDHFNNENFNNENYNNDHGHGQQSSRQQQSHDGRGGRNNNRDNNRGGRDRNNNQERGGRNNNRDNNRGGRNDRQDRNQNNHNDAPLDHNQMQNQVNEMAPAPAPVAPAPAPVAPAPVATTGFRAKRFSSRKATNDTAAPAASVSVPSSDVAQSSPPMQQDVAQDGTGSPKKGWWNRLID